MHKSLLTTFILGLCMAPALALAETKRSPASCVTVQEYEWMREARLETLKSVLSNLETAERTRVETETRIFDACTKSGEEEEFCHRIVEVPEVEQADSKL